MLNDLFILTHKFRFVKCFFKKIQNYFKQTLNEKVNAKKEQAAHKAYINIKNDPQRSAKKVTP